MRMGVLGAAALLGGCAANGRSEEEAEAAPTGPMASGDRAVMLSTWDAGLVANKAGVDVLAAGGSVLDAVVQAVSVIESDFSHRSVGLGGMPDRDGVVTLDACVQDHGGQAGSVAFMQRFENPVQVARAVMERTPHVMLVGEGAERWALANGFKQRQVEVPEVRKAWEEWRKNSDYRPVVNIENHDTIGCIGRDAQGRMAGSCTTSGMAYKVHGRVGDSPIIGAGLFVDGEVGAACATGVGELVIRTAGCAMVVEQMRHGLSPEEACKTVVERIMRQNKGLKDMQVGFLALRADGAHGAWSVYNGFTYALSTADGRTELHEAPYNMRWVP